MQGLQVGRIVHFFSAGGDLDEPTAAMIVHVHNSQGLVNLHVFGDGRSYYQTSVAFSEAAAVGRWSWPARG